MIRLYIFYYFLFVSPVNHIEDRCSCPLTKGEILPYLGGYVLGEGKRKGVSIKGEITSEVLSISKGIVSSVDIEKNIVVLLDIENDTEYIYKGVVPIVKRGDRVNYGNVLGILDQRGFLFLSIKRKNKVINPLNIIDCPFE